MALDLRQNFLSAHYLENKLIDICTSVMALDLCRNLVSVQYLENQLVDFHQILYMHLY